MDAKYSKTMMFSFDKLCGTGFMNMSSRARFPEL